MKMVLVTGASGFIGKNLCARLSNDGLHVRGALRSADQRAKRSGGWRQIVIGKVGAATGWDAALQEVEVVVHLAARVHVVRDGASHPLAEFRRVNVAGTLNLARQAADAGVRRFVFVSSIKVNGEETAAGQFFTEKDAPAPQDAYALSKWEAEQGLLQLAAETGMEVVVIRPPLVYGPAVKGNFFAMMRWLAHGVPLPLGAIHNQRSLVALDNLIDLIATCIDHPAAANQIFLVSDGEDISTTDLLQRTAAALNRPARLFPVPQKIVIAGLKFLGKAYLAQRLCGSLQVDSGKARRLLRWLPPVGVDEGLRKTAQYFWKHQWS